VDTAGTPLAVTVVMRRSIHAPRLRAALIAALAIAAGWSSSCGGADRSRGRAMPSQPLAPASTTDEEERTGVPGELNPMPSAPEADGGATSPETRGGDGAGPDAGVR
jgi:hypothetical protein